MLVLRVQAFVGVTCGDVPRVLEQQPQLSQQRLSVFHVRPCWEQLRNVTAAGVASVVSLISCIPASQCATINGVVAEYSDDHWRQQPVFSPFHHSGTRPITDAATCEGLQLAQESVKVVAHKRFTQTGFAHTTCAHAHTSKHVDTSECSSERHDNSGATVK